MGRPHQRLQPGAARPRERAEAGSRERAVLVDERHDIRDRRERDEVEQSGDAVVVSEQRARERVCDAGAAEIGTAVLRRPGRDDRAVRQVVSRACGSVTITSSPSAWRVRPRRPP